MGQVPLIGMYIAMDTMHRRSQQYLIHFIGVGDITIGHPTKVFIGDLEQDGMAGVVILIGEVTIIRHITI